LASFSSRWPFHATAFLREAATIEAIQKNTTDAGHGRKSHDVKEGSLLDRNRFFACGLGHILRPVATKRDKDRRGKAGEVTCAVPYAIGIATKL
jgi:hypothetical protein